MKQYSTKNYITKDEFYRMNKEEEFYTGFVIGLGYAFVEDLPITYLPEDLRINSLMSNFSVQRVDYSDEAYVRSLNLTSEQIKKIICTSNNNGTYNVAIDFLHHKVISDLSEVRVDFYEDGDIMKIIIEVHGESYVFPLVDFNKRYGQLISEVIGCIDFCNSSIGFGIDIFKNNYWSNPKFKKNISNSICQSLRRNGYKINASQIKRKFIPRAINAGNRFSQYIGVFCTIGSIYVEKEVKVSDIYSIAVAASTFYPGVGWAFGGVMFAADCISCLMSGKTIGEHLDDMFDDNGVVFDLKKYIDRLDFAPNSLSLDDMNNKYKSTTPFYEMEFVAPRDNTRFENPYIKKNW
ncbi:hypothetical protein DW039_02290 [Bacteroides sp. AF39-16AC]|uniref:hypothetical protein n=1 Tax=Bacteroides sp. AF39-16AC TaxID=2292936 RepID=UPI000EA0B890|nr:hypothetical protein [Bacteroides sp. AF39-16AC]RJU16159.1 hypothetical protein DW039_02290 [Bacteroides sp. AF39-16AC]